MDDLDDIFADAGGRDGRSEFELPSGDRQHARTRIPLPEAYRRFVLPHRERLSAEKGRPTRSSIAKERQAIRRWERWDREQRPTGFPDGATWTGLPVGYITSEYVERWITAAIEDGRLARATIASTWNHLRVVMNWLQHKSRVLDVQPTPDVAGTLDRLCEDDDGADLVHATYTLEELGKIYLGIGALDADRDTREQLQAAFVVSTCCGPRTSDLFALRLGDDVDLEADEPEMTYRARKTRKRHWCPLPPCVVDHLRRVVMAMRMVTGDRFFTIGAQRRNQLLKSVLRSVDLERFRVDDPRCDFAKPWQVGRSTAYSRADDVVDGTGRYLCHPPHAPKRKQSADVRANYLNWKPRLRRALLGMPQPPEFTEPLRSAEAA